MADRVGGFNQRSLGVEPRSTRRFLALPKIPVVAAIAAAIVCHEKLNYELTPFFADKPKLVYLLGPEAQGYLLVLGVACGATIAYSLTATLCSTLKYLCPDLHRRLRIAKQRAEQNALKPESGQELAPLPKSTGRLQLVLGENAETGYWFPLNCSSLFTGLLILGSVGAGKTTLLYRLVEQTIAFEADKPERCASVLWLDKKGDGTAQLKRYCDEHGRKLIVISTGEGAYRMNLFHGLTPEAKGKQIRLLFELLSGGGNKEHTWIYDGQEELLVNALGVLRYSKGYATPLDIYELYSGPLRSGEPPEDFFQQFIDAFESRVAAGEVEEAEREAFHHYLKGLMSLEKMNERNRATLTDSLIGVVRSLANPKTAKYFSAPPEEVTWPGIAELMQSGAVVSIALSGSDEGQLALIVGNLLLLDFMRCSLDRVRQAEHNPDALRRAYGLFIDEFQSYAHTSNHAGPDGDLTQFLALARQSRVVSAFATQSPAILSSVIGKEKMNALCSVIRNKFFMTQVESESAQYCSALAGQDYVNVPSVSYQEQHHKARYNPISDSLQSSDSTVSEHQSYSSQLRPRVDALAITELNNFEGIGVFFNGLHQLPPQMIYTKPHFLPVRTPHFDVLRTLQQENT